ncbi:MAG: DUF6134 family protein [Hyphomonadaceae bacterium]
MRTRRSMLALMAAAAIVPPARAFPEPEAWTPADGDQLYFDVFRDGGPFGRHVVSFRREGGHDGGHDGGRLLVDSDIDLKVNLGPITVFRYIHKASEVWADGRLQSVVARTRSDGRWKTLRAERQGEVLRIAGEAYEGAAPGNLYPSTHWNIAQMAQSEMLSTETGELLEMDVSDMGVEQVLTRSGRLDARRFLVRSDMTAAFWYDANGRWVKCAFETRGSKVDYVLRA